jgi:hypothetical protein
MSTSEGSRNIVTDGLVYYVDAANPRSYISGSTIWNDLTLRGRNGVLNGAPSYNSSNGGCIVFDGTDDFVSLPSVINTGQNFSVFAWIYPGNINVRNAIFGNGYPFSTSRGWLFSTATGYSFGSTPYTDTFFISIGNDNAFATANNNSIVRNRWNLVGATVTNGGQSLKLYVNGVETSYSTLIQTSINISYITNESSVGRRFSTNTELFRGRIAQTSIYDRVLTPTEILQNYNATRSRFRI